jgi:hypothetical protein
MAMKWRVHAAEMTPGNRPCLASGARLSLHQPSGEAVNETWYLYTTALLANGG